MIDIRLEKRLGDFTIDVAFKAKSNGITALFGPSGAGKTSAVNMVAGLARPDVGHIRIKDRCVYDNETGVNLPPEKRRFGYVFQEGHLFPHLTVNANLGYGMKRVPKADRYIEPTQVIELLDIGHLLNRRPATLSGGEKQRVAIGRALLTSPSLLIMDEPLAALDAERKNEVLPFIARLSSEFKIPVLYVSHSRNEIRALADTLVILAGGRISALGSINQLWGETISID